VTGGPGLSNKDGPLVLSIAGACVSTKFRSVDTVILGAGAAGMMCAIHAGARGGQVVIADHAKAPGEKIRISGGGRCNFTNIHTGPENFISENPHFAKSALKRYTQYNFIDLVTRHGIPYHEKTLGQLFCDTSARDIISMLLREMEKVGVELQLQTSIVSVSKSDAGFSVELECEGRRDTVTCRSFVVACGGKSIPKMGATGYGYRIAEQFGLPVTETRAALVPLVFDEQVTARFKELAGMAVDAIVECGGTRFEEAVLFTHRGLSGPAILQISSYWREKDPVVLSLLPRENIFQTLKDRRKQQGKRAVSTILSELLPRRLAVDISARAGLTGNIADASDATLKEMSKEINAWSLFPIGTEGYRTAEVTLGGVDTNALQSKSMEVKSVQGLYFIGEVVDVTGWLGGYNFQWAWSSGWAAGVAIAAESS